MSQTPAADTPPTPPVPPKQSESHAPAAAALPHTPQPRPAARRIRGVVLTAFLVTGITGLLLFGVPEAMHALNTVSTDDAYVNGRVSFVAARVPGQISTVLVEDNNRVRKGDLLAQLDKEPYQVQVNIRQAAVEAAQADLAATEARTRASEAAARAARFRLEHAIEDVENHIALLRSKVASLAARKSAAAKAQADYERAVPLAGSGAVAHEDLDRRKEAMEVAQAQVEESLQDVYQVRVSLGLPPQPENGAALADVPANLGQTFSSVREAQFALLEAAAQFGVTISTWNKTPKEMIAEFYQRDPEGNLDRIYEKLLQDAPAMLQARAKLAQAQRDLDQAKLDLSYCDIRAEIDGVVTRREAYPGNNVVIGQALMAIRSLTDVWIDANFKETQLAELRIGQPVEVRADMYGSAHLFKGRISGFTNGTGSTLALLPAENATGNFVKVVQRLPVRIELVEYDPDAAPLFTGLSVTPSVNIRATPSGENAGKLLQPPAPGTAPVGGATK